MLVPNPSQTDHSSAPPPYTSAVTLLVERPNTSISTGHRGGDAQSSMLANDSLFSSAATYFRDRPSTNQYPSYVLTHTLPFSPNTARDDLSFPQPEDQYQSRDVSLNDWNTFLNYLLPVDLDPVREKSGLGRSRKKDAFRGRDRIEAVLAEWHEGFFGPRGIQIEARFPAASRLETSPPPPFTSTVDVGHHPEAGHQRTPMSPQPPMPSQSPMSYGQSTLQWARGNLVGTRLGSGPLGRLLSGNSNQDAGLQAEFRSRPVRHIHDMRERRGRSLSSSSTSSSSSSSSSDSGHGGRGGHHRGGHRGDCHYGRHHHGHREHRRRRRSSSSSSSCSSRFSASLSSSELSGVDADEVRRSFVAMRQNLNNKAYLSTAVRQLKTGIRHSKRQHRDGSHDMRNMSKEQRHRIKAQGKGLKAELKSLVKEARAVRKADRKIRKAKRKAQRAHCKADKRGMNANDIYQIAVAKAEAKALKAQRRAVEANQAARGRAIEHEEGAKAQEVREWHSVMRPGSDQQTAERGLVEGTKSL
ncbi:MAG: hypothetical protein Q9211_003806 [Gyalolechia sp. 1 TL-2023]